MTDPARSTAAPADPACEDIRSSLSPEAIKKAFLDHLLYTQGKGLEVASKNDLYQSLSHTVRDRILSRWAATSSAYRKAGARTVAYLSAEFLMGPYLGNSLLSLDITD